ncbi:MAG: polyphosphate polymerase domain-containing protein [Bacilli bacterium]|nr:polyphosphate polymerase domain-containing protein [Bacilli bacterium]
MGTLKTFRHEYKYVLPYGEMLSLRTKFNELLEIDRSYDGYMIRSLYFDSVNDDDYYDKLGGELERKKIRLRIYEPDGELVKLELKAKHDYHQLKESLIINKEDAKELIKGNYGSLLNYKDDLANRLYVIMMKGYYRPKVIIEYQRIAYKTNTTTRITLDFNIKKSNDYDSFFNKNINYVGITDAKDIVLEVKFDRFLEPYISNFLGKYMSRCQSISKYVMARNI